MRCAIVGLLLDSCLLACAVVQAPAARADAAFDTFIQSLWPDAQKLGVSRATFDAATRGLEPDLSLPDLVLPGKPERPQPPQAEFVQTPADYVREVLDRAAGNAGQETVGPAPRDACGDRAALRRAAAGDPGDLGPRDRVRRPQAAAQRHPRAGDAGLRRPAQGHVPRGIPHRAENPAGGPRQARRHAQLLGRRDGAHAVPAVGILQARGRLRRRRPPRHLDLGAGCARRRGLATGGQGLAARQALGLRGEGAERHRLHHRRAGRHAADRRMDQARH